MGLVLSSRKRLIAVAISVCFASESTWANPTAPQVVNGSAAFSQKGGLLTVTNSNGAIINWNTFSIGAGETTRFNQASASSAVLNRVLGNDPSVLLGTLSSNGRVWLINPAGIMVGQGGRVDVAAFIASTMNVTNQEFLASRLSFLNTPGAGKVSNQGTITTPSGGSVYLVGPAVENSGLINAPNGEVILAAGQTVGLIDTGTPGVKVEITGSEGNVTNLGTIASEAGRIGIAGVLVKNSGMLNASSVVSEGGRIFLQASRKIELADSSVITADGSKGGTVVAKVEEAGQLSGEMVAGGRISAKGDGTRGSGGFVETSGKWADINSVSVVTGGGTWLLDPDDVEIKSTASIAGATLVTPATINAALISGNFVVQTNAGGTGGNGDIFVNEAVTSVAANTLTLSAGRDINVNQAITMFGDSGAVTSIAANTLTLSAGRDINVNQDITMSSVGAGVTLSAANNVNVSSKVVSAASGAISVSGTGLNVTGASAAAQLLGASMTINMSGSVNVTASLGSAQITSRGPQSITAGAGGITLVGGEGGNTIARISQTGSIATQRITVTGGGGITLTGGGASGTNGNTASISQAGSGLQHVTANAITLTGGGGSTGTGNLAIIETNGTATASQTVDIGAGGLTILGGSGADGTGLGGNRAGIVVLNT
ncbi:MAG: filamentous hemagglutinin N-terminal domain-containing protein, partial [Proteobacteria bacterium]|nr:filamentous hemagglutinin N-terminal domain-containing protein [Pseudomonadota bacterium]